jgi:predicted MFS family arabinose efflux permease
MGINRAVFLVFLTLGSLIGGSLGERFNRRKLLIFCEVIRIPIVFSLLLVSNPWMLVFINGLIAFFTGIFKPSRQTLVNDVVPSNRIKDANSLFGSTFAIIHMLGPLLGAGLYASLNGINEVVFFDLLTYFLGIFLLYRMCYKAPTNKVSTNKGMGRDIVEGLSFVWKRAELRCVLVNTVILGGSIGVLIPLLLPFIKEILGKSDFHYGILMAAFGLGGLIGAAITGKVSKFYSSNKLIIISVVLEAILFPLWIRVSDFNLNCIVIFIWGVVVFVRITSQLNYLSETVETEFLTRIYSLLDICFIIPNVGAGILIGIIGNTMSTFEILHYASIGFVILIAIRMFFPETKKLFYAEVKQVFRDPESFDSKE